MSRDRHEQVGLDGEEREHVETTEQRRAEEAAGALLEDDHVIGFGFELFADFEGLRIDLNPLPVGCINLIRIGFLASFRRGVEDRNL